MAVHKEQVTSESSSWLTWTITAKMAWRWEHAYKRCWGHMGLGYDPQQRGNASQAANQKDARDDEAMTETELEIPYGGNRQHENDDVGEKI